VGPELLSQAREEVGSAGNWGRLKLTCRNRIYLSVGALVLPEDLRTYRAYRALFSHFPDPDSLPPMRWREPRVRLSVKKGA
jgi:hypothetical protein